jgi:pimeloyl-ACP methyl ester carboxylesterase
VSISDALSVTRSGAGAPLLLLHGLGAYIFTWRFLKPQIPAAYEIFEIDLKGFGKAKKPADGKYSIFDRAELVFDLIATLDLDRVSFVGHSMGGGVALATALKVMDAGRRLERVVLIGSVAYRQDFTLPAQVRALVKAPDMPARAKASAFLALAQAPTSAVEEDAVAAYAENFRTKEGCDAFLSAADQLFAPELDNLAAGYPRITAPVLLVWGRKDGLVPLGHGQRLQTDIAGAKPLVDIASCGHIPHEEKPTEAVTKIAAFLAGSVRVLSRPQPCGTEYRSSQAQLSSSRLSCEQRSAREALSAHQRGACSSAERQAARRAAPPQAAKAALAFASTSSALPGKPMRAGRTR